LIRSLNNYAGAVVVISHDRNLLEAVVARLWLVDSGKVEPFEGSREDYRVLQLEKTKTDKKQSDKPENSRKRNRQERAESLKKIAPLKRKTQTLEIEFASAQKKLKAIDARLATENLFTTNPDEAVRLGQDRAKTEALIESLELDWLAALEAYDLAREHEGLD
jgi:ATP-binding cassette subfamily F protein 3